MKKKVVALTVFFILFSGLLPRYSLFTREYNDLACLIKNQPLLQYYFAFSSVSISIAEKLLAEHPIDDYPASQNADSSPINSSSDYSVANVTGKLLTRNHLVASPTLEHGHVNADCFAYAVSGNNSPVYKTVSTGIIGFLLLLFFFTGRPRGALEDGDAMTASRCSLSPIWRNSGLGFLVGGTI